MKKTERRGPSAKACRDKLGNTWRLGDGQVANKCNPMRPYSLARRRSTKLFRIMLASCYTKHPNLDQQQNTEPPAANDHTAQSARKQTANLNERQIISNNQEHDGQNVHQPKNVFSKKGVPLCSIAAPMLPGNATRSKEISRLAGVTLAKQSRPSVSILFRKLSTETLKYNQN